MNAACFLIIVIAKIDDYGLISLFEMVADSLH